MAAAEKVEGYVSKTINKRQGRRREQGHDHCRHRLTRCPRPPPVSLWANVSVKNDYTAYLDQYGYIIYVEEIEEIGNYALVLVNAADKGTFVGKKAELVLDRRHQ